MTYEKKTEILSLPSLKVTHGKPTPKVLYSAAIVQYGRTFLLVGGLDYGASSNAIYMYNTETGHWMERPQKLETPRGYAKSVLISDKLAKCYRVR